MIECVGDGADEAGAVGVEAAGAIRIEADGVDRAEGHSVGVDVITGGHGFEFVGDCDVAADESEGAHSGECFGDLAGCEFDADVAGVDFRGVERRLVEAWGCGVGDRLADHREASGFGFSGVEAVAGEEVVEGENIGHGSGGAVFCEIADAGGAAVFS